MADLRPDVTVRFDEAHREAWSIRLSMFYVSPKGKLAPVLTRPPRGGAGAVEAIAA